MWSDVDEAYARSFSHFCDGTIDAVVAWARDAGPAALEVGAGLGTLAAALTASGRRVVITDAQASMVQHASARLPELPAAVAALPRLPFGEASFDLVTANFVVNHLADPLAGVGELRRVVVPGGSAVVTIWPSGTTVADRLWSSLMDRAGVSPPPGSRLPPDKDFDRTADGLAGVLEGGGWRRVEVVEHEWTLAMAADDLWFGVRAGITRIGAAHRVADDAGRERLESAWAEHVATLQAGVVRLPMRALLARAVAA